MTDQVWKRFTIRTGIDRRITIPKFDEDGEVIVLAPNTQYRLQVLVETNAIDLGSDEDTTKFMNEVLK